MSANRARRRSIADQPPLPADRKLRPLKPTGFNGQSPYEDYSINSSSSTGGEHTSSLGFGSASSLATVADTQGSSRANTPSRTNSNSPVLRLSRQSSHSSDDDNDNDNDTDVDMNGIPRHSRTATWENMSELPLTADNLPDRARRNSLDSKKASESMTGWASYNLGLKGSNAKKFIGKHLKKLSIPKYTKPAPTLASPNYYLSSPNEKALSQADRRTLPNNSIHHRLLRVLKRPLAVLLLLLLSTIYLLTHPLLHFTRSSRFLGNGSKYVIILASNTGGGVLEWKNGKKWAVERLSVANKKAYADRHGYTLEIRDMKDMKRYAHEWRESWEKVDVVRAAMRKYPHAEWFWYLDIQTFIMEPELTLEKHIFSRLEKITYRDINHYNPLNITHPPTQPWLDPVTRSKNGDGKVSSMKLLIPQDCGGFNMGSFFAKRGEWTDRLFDVWWDPVGYEQKHQAWEHKDQDVLEHLYVDQPWTRNGIAFLPQRLINSFPPGACSDYAEDKTLFYSEQERDFVVNMAGCEWGRDCEAEMKFYKNISDTHSRWK